MYAHVRTYTRTRRNFSDNKSALQHCQTKFHHQSVTIHFYYPITVQSISILEPHWLHHLYKPLPYVTHLPLIYHPLATITQLSTNFNHLLLISNSLSLLPIISNSPSAHHIPFLSDFHSNQLTILSICQYIIKLC